MEVRLYVHLRTYHRLDGSWAYLTVSPSLLFLVSGDPTGVILSHEDSVVGGTSCGNAASGNAVLGLLIINGVSFLKAGVISHVWFVFTLFNRHSFNLAFIFVTKVQQLNELLKANVLIRLNFLLIKTMPLIFSGVFRGVWRQKAGGYHDGGSS
jgi:hypothetical protein